MYQKIILFLFLLTFSYYLLSTDSFALEIQSPRFKIQVTDISIDENKDTPAVYTLASRYGTKAFNQFNSQGFFVDDQKLDEALVLSIMPSLLTMTNFSTNTNQTGHLTYSISNSPEKTNHLNLIQQYQLKNLIGETIELNYSLTKEDKFRPLPNQNSGDFPSLILANNVKSTGKIFFKLDSLPIRQEGTFETVIDFIATPGY